MYRVKLSLRSLALRLGIESLSGSRRSCILFSQEHGEREKENEREREGEREGGGGGERERERERERETLALKCFLCK